MRPRRAHVLSLDGAVPAVAFDFKVVGHPDVLLQLRRQCDHILRAEERRAPSRPGWATARRAAPRDDLAPLPRMPGGAIHLVVAGLAVDQVERRSANGFHARPADAENRYGSVDAERRVPLFRHGEDPASLAIRN